MSVIARPGIVRRGLQIEYIGLTYNVLEAGIGLAAGAVAGSVALLGFGLDSVVEASSSVVIIWRLNAERSGAVASDEAERRAIRMVAVAFYALAVYVAANSIWVLARGVRPDESTVGIALAMVSLVVMPWLAWRKRQIAAELSSPSMHADSKQTTLCTYLSAFLLIGLVANAWLGWWWADPVAGLAISVFAVREGRALWNAEDLCC